MGTHSPSPWGASSPGAAIAGAEAAWRDLRALVGQENVRTGGEHDAADGIVSQMIIEPANAAEVARALKIATDAGLHVIPRGGGTKMDWGNCLRRDGQSGELILSTRRLNRVIEHAWGDMTATVEAGCTFQQFQQTLAAHGQRLALDPLWPGHATIGGILASNDSGPLRVRFGSLRDLIIGVTLALPDGTLAKSGGKVVKNVAGYDLPKLATGSLGTCLIGLNRLDEAAALLPQIDAKAVAQLSGDPDWGAGISLSQAEIAYRRHDYPAARNTLQTAAPVFTRADAEPYQKHAFESLKAALDKTAARN